MLLHCCGCLILSVLGTRTLGITDNFFWDTRINVYFAPLCLPKWRSPCNQNSLNVLWILGTDFCAWVQTWLGISFGVLGIPSLAGETYQLKIANNIFYGVCSIQFSHSVMSNSLWPHGIQHARFSCPSPTPRACLNSFPSSQWCHPTIYPLD